MKLWNDWIAEAKKGNINIQQCIDCKHKQFYPRDFCLDCSSKEVEFLPTDGSGVVYSYTEVHRSPNKEIFKTPYFVGIVEIEEGIRIICNLLFKDGKDKIGKKVYFQKISEEEIIYYSE